MRKLTVALGLVVVMALGLVAIGERQPARAATGDNLVLVWNEETLDAIRTLSPGPTVAVRALAVVHTAIYDAWAAYDPVAVGTRLGANLRRPTVERTQANKDKAVSFAAYLALVDLFPARQAASPSEWPLGYATDGTDTSTGGHGRDHRGPGGGGLSPQRRRQPAQRLCRHQRYTPVNTWDKVVDPDRWQPLCVPLPPPGATECLAQQKYLTPHWRTVVPFGLKSADQYRPDYGPAVSVEKGKPSSAYLKEVDQQLLYSASLTDTHKVIAEYWSDGPRSELPPGTGTCSPSGCPAATATAWTATPNCSLPSTTRCWMPASPPGTPNAMGLGAAHHRGPLAQARPAGPGLGWPLSGHQDHPRRGLAALPAQPPSPPHRSPSTSLGTRPSAPPPPRCSRTSPAKTTWA